MSNRKRREKRRKAAARLQEQTAPLQPGSKTEIESRRQLGELRTENRILRAQVGELDPTTWPPRYRSLISRLVKALLELDEAASPIKGRVLQPAGRSGGSTSMVDEGASTRNARRMQDRIVREVNAVLDGSWNPTLEGKRCRRSPNQCPMSGKRQRPAWADHVLQYCAGCGQPFPVEQRKETA